MAVSERERLLLYEQLTEEVGPGLAETLMDHIPPVKWDELVTKDDLRQMGDQLRSEMREGFTAMELRLSERFAEQTRWMADRFAEQDRRIAEMDRRFTDRFAEQTRKAAEQTRIIVLALIGMGVTVCGSLLGSGFF